MCACGRRGAGSVHARSFCPSSSRLCGDTSPDVQASFKDQASPTKLSWGHKSQRAVSPAVRAPLDSALSWVLERAAAQDEGGRQAPCAAGHVPEALWGVSVPQPEAREMSWLAQDHAGGQQSIWDLKQIPGAECNHFYNLVCVCMCATYTAWKCV